MIRSFRHRGLKKLYEDGDSSKLRADQVGRVSVALADLDAATSPQQLDLPGYRLHPLKGDRKGFWSISISGNWRIIFRFENGHACDVELIDYH
ncbi:MAG: type II toxin-antitoxin system RelE/ParE family toxin [Acidobacteriia bacterium]|nr:type II toxin-antitoxin system RelE/ParE family toxin [Terriglobia bacterium]